MPTILHIETATEVCSVAVSQNKEIIFEKISTEGPSHATLLGAFVAEAIQTIRQNNLHLDAVSVSCGPGSYTGLRIGVSEAKGLCYGLAIPLIAIKTPLIIAKQITETCNIDSSTLICPMIDARRMEVYAAIYDNNLNEIKEVSADIVDQDTYDSYLAKSKVIFGGNGAAKCKSTINSANAIFADNVYPLARYMTDLAEKAFNEKLFVDTAYFEPFYLKDFVATTPKNSILEQISKQ